MKKQIIIFWIIVLLVAVGLSGCNEQGESPKINFFTATPSVIVLGDSSILNWSIEGATSVSIDNGIGNVALDGHYTIIPEESKNYTYNLTATNSYGTSTASVIVYVVRTTDTIDEKNKFIGTWKYLYSYVPPTIDIAYDHLIKNMTLTFYENNSVHINATYPTRLIKRWYNYTAENGTFQLTSKTNNTAADGFPYPLSTYTNYVFSNDNNTLSLSCRVLMNQYITDVFERHNLI